VLPPVAAHLVAFGRALRAHGLAVAPEQQISFLAAIGLLGPRAITDIWHGALATFAPQPSEHGLFRTVFEKHFCGAGEHVPGAADADENLAEDRGDIVPIVQEIRVATDSSAHAADDVLYSERAFATGDPPFAALAAAIARRLPRRRSFRMRPLPNARNLDLRRSMRTLAANDGDLPHLRRRARQPVTRRLIVLIDISGSMKAQTEGFVRLAHALVQQIAAIEVFAVGTALTCLTPDLRCRDRTVAMAAAARRAADWDGGTRLGPALLALLAAPVHNAFARGAVVLLLSDGLERGDGVDWQRAIERLRALAHRLILATPLAGDPMYRPTTRALAATAPCFDAIIDGSSVAALGRFFLTLDPPSHQQVSA
jgi:uncharacterized protein with von Willebrand factor type A (vWA) domain